jgi:hypothetical protein
MGVAWLILGLVVVTSPSYGADPAAKCAAAKRKAAGKKIAAKMTCHGKAKAIAAPVDSECLTRAETRFTAAVTKAGAACAGDASFVEGVVDQCVDQLLGDVPGDGGCPSRSAKIVGKWGGALMRCAARNELASPGWTICHSARDAKYSGALATAGGCASGATDLDLHDECVEPLVAALPPSATTTTTTTQPCVTYLGQCLGSCGPGETCGPIGLGACACFTPTGCQASTYPACGGECPAGETCYPVRDVSGFHGCFCGATGVPCAGTPLPCDGLACPPGFVCFVSQPEVDGCACAAP